MGFRINTNVDALSAYINLDKTNKMATQSQMRLASGKRINSVADDTSGYNIGKSLEGRLQVMKSAQFNIGSAKNLLSTAEGSLAGVNDLLIKIEGKMSDATNPTADRARIADDIKALASEIQSTLESTKFNNTSLLTGTAAAGGFTFQIGPELSADRLKLDFADSLLTGTNVATNINTSLGNLKNISADHIANYTSSSSMGLESLSQNLSSLKSAVSTALGKIGNFSQRLDIKDDVLNTAITNTQSSYSRIFDADMAMEQLNATRGSIIGQAGLTMLAQLNQAPGQVLSLFR